MPEVIDYWRLSGVDCGAIMGSLRQGSDLA
jgi:hypothetical protein